MCKLSAEFFSPTLPCQVECCVPHGNLTSSPYRVIPNTEPHTYRRKEKPLQNKPHLSSTAALSFSLHSNNYLQSVILLFSFFPVSAELQATFVSGRISPVIRFTVGFFEVVVTTRCSHSTALNHPLFEGHRHPDSVLARGDAQQELRRRLSPTALFLSIDLGRFAADSRCPNGHQPRRPYNSRFPGLQHFVPWLQIASQSIRVLLASHLLGVPVLVQPRPRCRQPPSLMLSTRLTLRVSPIRSSLAQVSS
jgi:hypothetical protein